LAYQAKILGNPLINNKLSKIDNNNNENKEHNYSLKIQGENYNVFWVKKKEMPLILASPFLSKPIFLHLLGPRS